MKLQLETYDGAKYELPTLLSWDLDITSSVPCDSLTATCIYDPEMSEILPKATRFTALEDGETKLRGVVDAYEITLSRQGLLATIEGRGLAALLLDNESEALTYGRALLSEILENHVSPYNIPITKKQDVSGYGYAVASGSSQWKALQGFTSRFGGFDPYFTPDGTLVTSKLWGTGKRLSIDDKTPVISLQKREQRYGVISEMLIQDKTQRISHRVPNQTFIDHGGQRRHVLYMPRSSTAEDRRYTGEYQIAQSALEQTEISIELPYPFAANPGDHIKLALSKLSLAGEYEAVRARSQMDSNGARTTLTLSVR